MERIILIMAGSFVAFMLAVVAYQQITNRGEEKRQKREQELWDTREKLFSEKTAQLSRENCDLEERVTLLSEQVENGQKELEKTLKDNSELKIELKTISSRLDGMLDQNNRLDKRVASLEKDLEAKNEQLIASELREAEKDKTIHELSLRIDIFKEVLSLLHVTVPDVEKPEEKKEDGPV